MTDIVDTKKRSQIMSNIRHKDTSPELVVRRDLHRHGFRFRLHSRQLPGVPDLVLPKHKAIVLVHGCYWHRHSGCQLAYSPKSRVAFWNEKFRKNVERDKAVAEDLKSAGWRIATIWECCLRKQKSQPDHLQTLAAWIRSDVPEIEIPRPN